MLDREARHSQHIAEYSRRDTGAHDARLADEFPPGFFPKQAESTENGSIAARHEVGH